MPEPQTTKLNRLQANICLLCVTLCWSLEVILYSCIPRGVPAFVSLAGWFAEDPRLFFGLPASRTLVAAWAIYAYFIVAFAQALNVSAMRRVTAANATVVYSVEIVFSLAWGALLPAGVVERIALSPRILLGAAFVVAGSLAEILDLRGKRKEAEE